MLQALFLVLSISTPTAAQDVMTPEELARAYEACTHHTGRGSRPGGWEPEWQVICQKVHELWQASEPARRAAETEAKKKAGDELLRSIEERLKK